ncbi:hypothetical protein [Paenibacillus gorillae]|uniref:DUF1281 family ferredoxin-like fold protein n=1 Tax=Paenibacillus gorillae TaxID=1243662 RepID=UPI0004BC1C3A|nr:hypothetical protein [Paenibacillus gorillae]
MPNHITNVITIQAPEGRSVKDVIDFVSSEDQSFDFNKLIPMPQEEIDSIGTPGISPLWYRWSNHNWGTKWNAYEISINENVIKFDTAWASPIPIFKALSKQFPEFVFDIKYADEDYGYNFGHFKFDSVGILDHSLPDSGTPEARKWIFENVVDRPDYYDENGNYIEEEE